MKNNSSLTIGEQKKLAELESTIEAGLKSFYDVGTALMAIRDRHLYSDVHTTFEGYCKKKWGFARAHAYRLIGSAKVVDNLSPMGDIPAPSSERVARELAEIEDETKQADVWAKANKTAPKDSEGKPKVTAAHVAKVRNEVVGEKTKPEPAKPAPKTASHPDRPELVGLKKIDTDLGVMIRSATEINRDLAPSKHYDEFKRGLDIACQALSKWRQQSK